MPAFTTRDLALYGSIVGTLNGLWVLYHGVVRDRARIVVRAYRAEAVTLGGVGPREDAFMVTVSNRGRRSVTINGVAYTMKTIRGTQGYPRPFMEQLQQPKRLDESESFTLRHGPGIGYRHGDLPTKRWFATDGAGRIHPLRERYRQRVERIVFWPIRKWLDRRHKRRRRAQPGG